MKSLTLISFCQSPVRKPCHGEVVVRVLPLESCVATRSAGPAAHQPMCARYAADRLTAGPVSLRKSVSTIASPTPQSIGRKAAW